MKNTKRIFTSLILSGTLISLITSNVLATTELEAIQNEDSYIQSVVLRKSELENYKSQIQDQIIIGKDTYQFDNFEKKVDTENNTKEVEYSNVIEELYDTNDKEDLMKMVAQKYPYEENGFIGEIPIKDVLIETISQGTYQKIESLDIDFTNYKGNDLSNIEKVIQRNGYQWNLINVDWKVESTKNIAGTEVPQTYKGVMHYQRVGTYNYPSKYKVTALYSGTVTAQDIESIYEVQYTKVSKKFDIRIPIVIGAVGILVILIVLLYIRNKKKKEKQQERK